jgi:uncharacterized Zn-binding protein involved in type VI secretion
MKDARTGREVAREGDTTDHGGRVLHGADTLMHQGRRVALDRTPVDCPKCGGVFGIRASGPRTHCGVLVAYLEDETDCGARLMKVQE